MTTAENLAVDLIGTVVDAARFSPRNRQVAIGPSEIGHPCNRHLAYKTMGALITRTDSDPWASIVGTAVHAWLASAFAAANLVLDEPRWLVEQRVHPTPGLSGSCDLYDLWLDAVIDHKVVGTDALSQARAHGPSQQYRVQGQIYGLGWERLGRSPREVAIAYWPRGPANPFKSGSGGLSGMYLHREPYDRQVAIDALDRLSLVSAAAATLNVDTEPAFASLIPCTPDDHCRYCPYRSMDEGDGGCCDAPKAEVAAPRGRVAGMKL
jgi:hypothetical protein